MARPVERRWLGRAFAYAALLLVVAGLTTIFYISVSDGHKPLVIRLATGVLAAVVFLHVHSRLRKIVADMPPSELERVLHLEPSPVRVDPLLSKLCDELRNSATSWRHFERVLWPLLLGLAARNRKPGTLPEPRANWLHRRGPSLRTLRTLVEQLEEDA